MDNPILKYKKNFVIRTIKNGRVKIHGRYYYPNNVYEEYDGRLDSMRYAFGLYYIYLEEGYELQPYAQLWGTEEMYKAVNEDQDKLTSLFENDPQIVDGAYPWIFWKTKDYQKQQEENRIIRI